MDAFLVNPPLAGLRAVVDVQHIYRSAPFTGDRGAVFTLAGGLKVAEADLSLQYAESLRAFLEAQGAAVWGNDPHRRILIGPYSARQRSAAALGANAYFACHVNAGGGAYALVEHMEVSPPRSNVLDPSVMAIVIANEIADSFPEISFGKVVALTPGERGSVCIRHFTAGPAVLLEPFFGDNRQHQGLMNAAGMALVGAAIGRGVLNWWSRFGPAPLAGPA